MQYQLAEINIATFRVPMNDPVNAEFIASLDRVNALAEAAPGFVWRLVGEGNNALEIKAFDNPNTAINMSVWSDMDALADFVYRNDAHREIMRRRKEWFDRMHFPSRCGGGPRDIGHRSAKERSVWNRWRE